MKSTNINDLPIQIYNFHNSRVHISVKATDIASAIEWLKVIFGDRWVKYNLDDMEIDSYKPNMKSKDD